MQIAKLQKTQCILKYRDNRVPPIKTQCDYIKINSKRKLGKCINMWKISNIKFIKEHM